MGGASSMAVADLNKSQAELVNMMLPIYYNPEDLVQEELDIASKGWKLILFDKSPEYLRLKVQKDFPYGTCMSFFYDQFYQRMFDVHPMSRKMFKRGMKSQGKFLVKMITLALCNIQDIKKHEVTFVKLAEMHNSLGVKSIECKFTQNSTINSSYSNNCAYI